jgi:hypothetical protein
MSLNRIAQIGYVYLFMSDDTFSFDNNYTTVDISSFSPFWFDIRH